MTLHLIKLCVGADSVDDLAAWIDFRQAEAIERGLEPEHKHTTRMVPKRADEIVGTGSLFWVIKGYVQARQRIIAIRPFRDDDGINRCDLVLDRRLVRTQSQPRRPFQGWRYLNAEDAPADLRMETGENAPPEEMRRQLAELALI